MGRRDRPACVWGERCVCRELLGDGGDRLLLVHADPVARRRDIELVAHHGAFRVLGPAVDVLGCLLDPLGDRGLIDGDLGFDLGGKGRAGDLTLQPSNEACATPRLVCAVERALDIDSDQLLGIELPGVTLA